MGYTSIFFKKHKAFVLLFVVTLIVVCCKTNKPTTNAKTPVVVSPFVPVKTDIALAIAHWPGTTLDTLNRGYSIFESKCTECHEEKRPQDFGAHDWLNIMHQMGRKAKLTTSEDTVVLHYILTRREAIMATGGN
jgi:hypothetical protein